MFTTRNTLLVNLFLLFLLCFSLQSCKPELKRPPQEEVELMLIGLPEHIDTNVLFKEGVSYFNTHKGLEVYMRYEKSNPNVLLKICQTINDVGEPNYPVPVNYYHKKVDTELQGNLWYVLKYLANKQTGELVPNNKEEYNCDLFGLWIAVYTHLSGQKKYFLFDCYGLPDSLHHLCNQIRPWKIDSSFIPYEPTTLVNTDSLASLGHQKLKPEFDARYQKFQSRMAHLKFTPPMPKETTD